MTLTPSKPLKKSNAHLSAADQRRRFIETARELGCDESEERFDAVLKAVAKHQPVGTPSKKVTAAKPKPR